MNPARRKTSYRRYAPEGVLARIRLVVDREEDGNVSEAARRSGVSARGLQKIISGQTRDPRISFLVRFSDAYRLDPTWLLTGSAAGSSPDIERAATRRAAAIVKELAVKAAEGLTDQLVVVPDADKRFEPDQYRAPYRSQASAQGSTGSFTRIR